MSLKRIEKKRNLFEEINKKKSEILLLKKKPANKIEWPWAREEYVYPFYTSFTPIYYKAKEKPRTLYRKNPLKRRRNFPLYNNMYSSTEVHIKTNNEMNELVDEMLSKDLKGVDESKIESIQTLSLNLLDRMFTSLADISLPVSETSKADIGWEYVMGNMLELGLPQTVIDRVKKRMEKADVESSPAITAMNVTRPLLSDLTITTAEVEMQEEIRNLVIQKELFEPKPGDEPFEDSVKWLIELDRKDQYSKDKEIEEINLDYTKLL